MINSEAVHMSSKCKKCESNIGLNYSKFKGGDNDSEKITYICDSCGEKDTTIIKNSETLTISGATLIDSEYLN